jgi:tripartite-type tricarboxylate transporter receptor subunit TctC
MRDVKALVVMAFFTAAAPSAFAQSFPSKPIRVVATSTTGNAGDTAMRLVAPSMSAALGQPILIENRPQGLGQPAMVAVKEAAPDGYTLLHSSVTNMTWTPFLSKEARTNTMKDFVPIAKLIDFPNLVTVSAALPVNNLAELIEYGKRNPGKLTYGTTGLNAGWEFFPEALGVKMVNVPYANQSVGQTVNDLATDRINVLFYSYASVAPVLNSGRVKVLAQVSRTRTKVLSQVPTVYEAVPDFPIGPAWFGLFGPAGVPAPIIHRVHGELSKALADPEATAKLEGVGTIPARGSVEEFAQEVRRDYELFGRLAKTLNLQPM